MFDRFTDHAKQWLNLARVEAQRLHHAHIGTEHLLLGLPALEHFERSRHTARPILRITAGDVRAAVDSWTPPAGA